MLIISACQKPDPFLDIPKKQRAFLHILNAFAPKSIDIRITNYEQTSTVADDVGFLESWPASGYASLLITPGADSLAYIDELNLEILDHQTKERLVPQPDFVLNPEVPTSIFVIDSFGKAIVVRTADQLPEKNGNDAQVRFMNLSPNVLSVSLEVKSDTFNIDRLNFLNYSGFASVARGPKTFYFVNDFTNAILDSIPNLELRPQRAYSFYLVNKNNIPMGGYEILDQ